MLGKQKTLKKITHLKIFFKDMYDFSKQKY